jgi:hypothetical protein
VKAPGPFLLTGMLKHFFSPNVDHGVGFLASANLITTASVQTFVSDIEPTIKVLVLLGQVAVAAVTVFYVYRKAKAVRVPRKYVRKHNHTEPNPPVSN